MPKFKIDMTNVEERVLVPEGEYICKVAKVTLETSENSGGKYLKWEIVIAAGEYKGNKLYHNTSLKPNALFNLRNTIIALGLECPKSVQTIDTDKFVGKIVGVTVKHEEYQNKPKSTVADMWKAAKGPKGWGRAEQIAAKRVTDNTPEEQEEEEVDTATEDDEGIEEIEV
jgi:hypothetical protein